MCCPRFSGETHLWKTKEDRRKLKRTSHRVVAYEASANPWSSGALELGQSFRVSKIQARGLALVSLITYSLAVNCSCRRGTRSSYLLLCNNYSKLNNLKQQTCYYILQICGLGNQTGLGWLIFLIYISSTGVSLWS